MTLPGIFRGQRWGETVDVLFCRHGSSLMRSYRPAAIHPFDAARSLPVPGNAPMTAAAFVPQNLMSATSTGSLLHETTGFGTCLLIGSYRRWLITGKLQASRVEAELQEGAAKVFFLRAGASGQKMMGHLGTVWGTWFFLTDLSGQKNVVPSQFMWSDGATTPSNNVAR